MKCVCSLALALSVVAVLALPALAAGGSQVSGVIETPDAVFFQPSQFPAVVWFFPKTELDLAIVPPQLPTGTFWRVAVVFKQITEDDLALLPAEWGGKSFVPFLIRPTSECALTRIPEMRYIIQEVEELGRDVSTASPPVCRFTFQLPTHMSPDLQERLDALVRSDTLVERDLTLELQIEATVPWVDVHKAVAAMLAESLPPGRDTPLSGLTPATTRAVVQRALASPALAVVSAAVTPPEQQAFIDATLTKLFTYLTGTNLLRLVIAPPTGVVVYHRGLFRLGV